VTTFFKNTSRASRAGLQHADMCALRYQKRGRYSPGDDLHKGSSLARLIQEIVSITHRWGKPEPAETHLHSRLSMRRSAPATPLSSHIQPAVCRTYAWASPSPAAVALAADLES
jgi:hypothetical protein